ncbi:MAG: PilN domain-containing protein [Thermodesulfobacteriota bacterium]
MTEGINLIPDEIKRGWRLRRVRFVLGCMALIYLAALAGVYLYQGQRIAGREAELESLEAQRTTLSARNTEYPGLVRQINAVRKKEAALKRRLDIISSLVSGRISWLAVMKVLSLSIPKEVWLRGLATADADGKGGDKEVRFIGTAISNTAVADFVFVIENSPYFHDIGLSYSQKREFKGRALYDFEAVAKLKKVEDIIYD